MSEDAVETLLASAREKKIGVLLVDDHIVVRQGLRMIIEMQKEYDGITNNDHSMFKFRFVDDRVEVSVQETAHDVGAQFVGSLQEQ